MSDHCSKDKEGEDAWKEGSCNNVETPTDETKKINENKKKTSSTASFCLHEQEQEEGGDGFCFHELVSENDGHLNRPPIVLLF